MKPWAWIWLIVLGLPVGCVAISSIPDTLVTYRMVATVEDSGKLIQGRSVRRYTFTPGGFSGLQVGQASDVGDSVIVPIRGRLLVVTHASWFAGGSDTCLGRRRSDGGLCDVMEPWRPSGIIGRRDRDGPVELEPSEYPVLVTFNGAPSLRSVVAVDPDRLEEAFGPGVKLRSITVARTFGFVSRNQARQLPFVKTLTGNLTCRVREEPNDRAWSPENQTQNPSLGTCITKGFF